MSNNRQWYYFSYQHEIGLNKELNKQNQHVQIFKTSTWFIIKNKQINKWRESTVFIILYLILSIMYQNIPEIFQLFWCLTCKKELTVVLLLLKLTHSFPHVFPQQMWYLRGKQVLKKQTVVCRRFREKTTDWCLSPTSCCFLFSNSWVWLFVRSQTTNSYPTTTTCSISI